MNRPNEPPRYIDDGSNVGAGCLLIIVVCLPFWLWVGSKVGPWLGALLGI